MRLPQSLLERCPVREFPAGQTIFRCGDEGDEMFLVTDGEVEIRFGDQPVEVVGPEHIFGELSLIDRSPRSADAVARTDCRLVAINQHRFTFMVDEVPFFAIRVMQVMADRLRRNARASS